MASGATRLYGSRSTRSASAAGVEVSTRDGVDARSWTRALRATQWRGSRRSSSSKNSSKNSAVAWCRSSCIQSHGVARDLRSCAVVRLRAPQCIGFAALGVKRSRVRIPAARPPKHERASQSRPTPDFVTPVRRLMSGRRRMATSIRSLNPGGSTRTSSGRASLPIVR
jgi:hypothetical protein